MATAALVIAAALNVAAARRVVLSRSLAPHVVPTPEPALLSVERIPAIAHEGAAKLARAAATSAMVPKKPIDSSLTL